MNAGLSLDFTLTAMYFPAVIAGLRRLGRWFLYELFQLALWGAYALHLLGGLRSAFGGGGAGAPDRRPGPAIRPRRTGGPGRGERLIHRAAA